MCLLHGGRPPHAPSPALIDSVQRHVTARCALTSHRSLHCAPWRQHLRAVGGRAERGEGQRDLRRLRVLPLHHRGRADGSRAEDQQPLPPSRLHQKACFCQSIGPSVCRSVRPRRRSPGRGPSTTPTSRQAAAVFFTPQPAGAACVTTVCRSKGGAPVRVAGQLDGTDRTPSLTQPRVGRAVVATLSPWLLVSRCGSSGSPGFMHRGTGGWHQHWALPPPAPTHTPATLVFAAWWCDPALAVAARSRPRRSRWS